jgi:hypothetical protein
LAFTVHNTALNPAFLRTEINELDIHGLVTSYVTQSSNETVDGGVSELQVVTALSDTVTQMEPLIKERIGAASDGIYAYLLGKTPALDLAGILRGTILKADFITGVIDKIDFGPVIRQVLDDEISQAPPEYREYIGTAVSKVVVDIKPTVLKQIESSADPMLDYFVGKTDNFSIAINVDQLISSLRTALHDAVFASLPPELQALPPAERETVFGQHFDNLVGGLSTSIVLDQSILGADARGGMVEGIRQAESGLSQARHYVALFQILYFLLIVLIVLLVAGIVLTYREVRGASRYLSVVLLSYGFVELAFALVGRYYAAREIPPAMVDIPVSLQTWIVNLSQRLLTPAVTFSVVLVVLGLILLLISFVFPKSAETV